MIFTLPVNCLESYLRRKGAVAHTKDGLAAEPTKGGELNPSAPVFGFDRKTGPKKLSWARSGSRNRSPFQWDVLTENPVENLICLAREFILSLFLVRQRTGTWRTESCLQYSGFLSKNFELPDQKSSARVGKGPKGDAERPGKLGGRGIRPDLYCTWPAPKEHPEFEQTWFNLGRTAFGDRKGLWQIARPHWRICQGGPRLLCWLMAGAYEIPW